MNNNKFFSKNSYINRVVIICWAIINSALSLAYIAEFIQKTRTIFDLFIIIIGLWGGWCFGYLVYKNNTATDKVKYILAIGFGIMYFYLIITSVSPTAFAFVFPLIAVSTIFMDPKLFLSMGIGLTIVNIIDVIYTYSYLNKTSPTDTAVYKTQLSAVILISIFSYIGTKVLKNINSNQIENIEHEKEKSEDLLSEIIERTDVITSNINDLENQSAVLKEKSNYVKETMETIFEGTKNSSESVQIQLTMTHQVNDKVESSFEMVNKINNGFHETKNKASTGMKIMENLNQSAQDTNSSSETVNQSINILTEKMSDVYKIVELINSIANQTKLLSLNASIELAVGM